MSPYKPTFTEIELNKITNHYIKDIIIDGYTHYLLIMDQFDITQIYNKDKYSILEVLQDIDSINSDFDIYTTYYEEYKFYYFTEC